MTNMERITALLTGIRLKHNIAATFQMDNFNGGTRYGTYIAGDIQPHQHHDMFEEAYQRLYDFHTIDDLYKYQKSRVVEKLKRLKAEREDMDEDITMLERLLEEYKNGQ